MGKWVPFYDKSSVKRIFWIYYAMGVIFNFFAIFGLFSVRYNNEKKQKAAQIGTALGFLLSIFVYILVAFLIILIVSQDFNLNAFLISFIGLLSSIIITIRIYRRNIRKLILEDEISATKQLILHLTTAFQNKKIKEEDFSHLTEYLLRKIDNHTKELKNYE